MQRARALQILFFNWQCGEATDVLFSFKRYNFFLFQVINKHGLLQSIQLFYLNLKLISYISFIFGICSVIILKHGLVTYFDTEWSANKSGTDRII